MKNIINYINKYIKRNKFDINGKKVIKDTVNLEWWQGATNIGDCLSPIVFEWMLNNKNILNQTKKTIHLFSIGSIIGASLADGVIWGSGIRSIQSPSSIQKKSMIVKYDIHAIRGPISKDALKCAGYECDEAALGDPAILMPLIYKPAIQKKYKYSVIYHLRTNNFDSKNCHLIDVKTDNYKKFIDEIVSSEVIISESLHGIIIAEAYGIPAVFLNINVSNQIVKYLDYYYSTNRKNIIMVSSVEEGMKVKPMEIPDFKKMQNDLINSFPYDLWK